MTATAELSALIDGINALFDAIHADYVRWTNAMPIRDATPEAVEKMREKRFVAFRKSLDCDLAAAKKYARVTSQGSAWGFIVLTDADPRFPVGTILKAASWAKPALNKPRGNVITRDFSWVNWTGPAYLK